MKLELKGLTKRFKDVTALDNVDLCLEKPGIYGLLGRNGAGKTTMLNIITARISASEGTVTLDGEPVFDSDSKLGCMHLMSEVNYLDTDLRFKEAVAYAKQSYGDKFDSDSAMRYAHAFKLEGSKKLGKLSTGYKSIYKCCLALAMDTEFVFFDEPVLGLDANHRDLFYRLLLDSYQRKEKVVVISTHLIEEAASMLEHFIIIASGRILMNLDSEQMSSYATAVSGPRDAVEDLATRHSVISRVSLGGLETAYIKGIVETDDPKLSVCAVDPQRLFIELTRNEEERV